MEILTNFVLRIRPSFTRSKNLLMDEGFELPVLYRGKKLQFPARLLKLGYIYKIEVDVNGTLIHFERDEERNWRALIDHSEEGRDNKPDIELLKAIGDVIEEATK